MSSNKKYDKEDLWMEEFEIQYCLSKQLSCMDYIHTNYGEITLDEEMKDIVGDALKRLLEKRLEDKDNLTQEFFK